MNIYKLAESLMAMDEQAWRRHANPWSVWTRIAMFPFWFLAIWSHVWIGWWALIPATLLAAWTWINPRAFGIYRNDEAWSTRGVLGERVFLNRAEIPIPPRHERAANLLTALALVALIGAVVGFVIHNFWLALGGWLLTTTFKLWFVDRMAWLYSDMRDHHAYVEWRRGS